MKELYFQVKYGYSPRDSITVKGIEVEKAIYAQITKTPVQIGDSYINGSNILVIRPAYYKHTGWYDTYEPKEAEDFKQIKKDCPNYDGAIDMYKKSVEIKIKTGKTKEIGTGKDIGMIENTYPIKEITKDLVNKFKIQ